MNSRQRRTQRRHEDKKDPRYYAEVEGSDFKGMPIIEGPYIQRVRKSDWFLYGAVTSLTVFTTFIMAWLQWAYWPEQVAHEQGMTWLMDKVTDQDMALDEAHQAVKDAVALCQ